MQTSELATLATGKTADGSLTNVLRLIGSFDDLDPDGPLTRKSSDQDWSKLIDHIRDVANHVREVEAQSQEQELHVQHLLERAREDIKEAADRVRAADARAADIQARSEALLKAADERVKAAEERARVAEGWLALIREAITSEFIVKQDTKRIA
ncbi:MAG: hypothetical protein K2Y56_15980 [Methylobacterium sp.]|nr:hypothetical protein [Methylobacterium sp.]